MTIELSFECEYNNCMACETIECPCYCHKNEDLK